MEIAIYSGSLTSLLRDCHKLVGCLPTRVTASVRQSSPFSCFPQLLTARHPLPRLFRPGDRNSTAFSLAGFPLLHILNCPL